MRLMSGAASLPLAAALAVAATGTASAPLAAQTVTATSGVVQLSTGRGRLVTLTSPMSDVFVADDKIADVQVRSPTQLYIFAKGGGETSVYATNKAGKVVYSTAVRVGNNFDAVNQMLTLAMPDAKIVATPMNGIVLLTGTVANPEDAAEAERLTQAFVGDSIKVLSRLRNATPLQVNLQVKIAEVSKNFSKDIGSNLTTLDGSSGFKFGVGSGRAPASYYTTDPRLPLGIGQTVQGYTIDPTTGLVALKPGTTITPGSQRTTVAALTKLLGLDILGALDLGERNGQVTTLANPNLTAISGETGSFLAGGKSRFRSARGSARCRSNISSMASACPIPPRCWPTVASTCASAGSIPAVGSGRGHDQRHADPRAHHPPAETTVELGSGQSMMIGGLLQNTHNNVLDKTPGAGDLPVLGALFRSNSFQRNETELMIIVTPYLVKPVDANAIVLPTDAYKAPTDAGRVFLGQLDSGTTGGDRPKPTVSAPAYAAPTVGAFTMPGGPAPANNGAPVQADKAVVPKPAKRNQKPVATPGFSFN